MILPRKYTSGNIRFSGAHAHRFICPAFGYNRPEKGARTRAPFQAYELNCCILYGPKNRCPDCHTAPRHATAAILVAFPYPSSPLYAMARSGLAGLAGPYTDSAYHED
ncbi:hypothetical protein EVAR_30575_1 [Eumeta japonica]|uniref:Uncharacterized protein n=1 Tax=Eumeta variegata TaxID=151549 RepID=A0A4C1VN23_EUMVA|nr:hypothetical protein EVAR_30575_1 [Eumeta japonica]